MFYGLQTPIYKPPVYSSSTWISIKDNFDLDIERLVMYYRYSNGYIKNSSFLNRLIDSVDVEPNSSKTNTELYVQLNETCRRLESTFNIAGSYDYGDYTDDYVNSNYNLYVSRTVNYTITDNMDILDKSCIGVLEHSNTDIPLCHPNKYSNGGVVIYYIDIVLMLLQYRVWVKSRTIGEPTSTGTFLYNVVYPNSIRSYIDVSLRNMCIIGTPSSGEVKDNSILLPSYISRLNKVSKDIHKYISVRRLYIYNILDKIPSLNNSTYYRYINSINMPTTSVFSKGVNYYMYIHIFNLIMCNIAKKSKVFNTQFIRRGSRQLSRFFASSSYINMNPLLKVQLDIDYKQLQKEIK